MKVKDIYRKYGIPPNLQEHMFRVAGVVEFVLNNWDGEILDNNRLVKIALIHDLGNIVKFTFDNPERFGMKNSEADFWKSKQKEVIIKYGSDDHEVTEEILKEIGFDEDSAEVISSKSFAHSIETSLSKDWYIKILLYADLRVLPLNIGTLQERFNDIKDRMPQYNKRKDLEDLFEACRKIESEIQDNLKVYVDQINDKNIKINKEKYLQMEI